MKNSTTPQHPGSAENHTAGNPRPGVSTDDAVNKSNVVNSKLRKVAGVSAAEFLAPDERKRTR
ncbi:MAG: hypothetical protein ABI905_18275 [Betaproteobacteria bacterium]